jgi:hypothetical protein
VSGSAVSGQSVIELAIAIATVTICTPDTRESRYSRYSRHSSTVSTVSTVCARDPTAARRARPPRLTEQSCVPPASRVACRARSSSVGLDSQAAIPARCCCSLGRPASPSPGWPPVAVTSQRIHLESRRAASRATQATASLTMMLSSSSPSSSPARQWSVATTAAKTNTTDKRSLALHAAPVQPLLPVAQRSPPRPSTSLAPGFPSLFQRAAAAVFFLFSHRPDPHRQSTPASRY